MKTVDVEREARELSKKTGYAWVIEYKGEYLYTDCDIMAQEYKVISAYINGEKRRYH